MLLQCLLGKETALQSTSFGGPLSTASLETFESHLASRSELFSALPEWFLDDLTELLLFTLQ